MFKSDFRGRGKENGQRHFCSKKMSTRQSQVKSSYNPATMFLGIYLPDWLENLCPHNDLLVILYGDFIHNHQKLNIIKISFNRWGQTADIHTMDYYSLIKRKATYCMLHFGKGNTIQMVKRLVVARGLGRERKGWKSKAQETSQGSETILQDVVMNNMTPCTCQNRTLQQKEWTLND